MLNDPCVERFKNVYFPEITIESIRFANFSSCDFYVNRYNVRNKKRIQINNKNV